MLYPIYLPNVLANVEYVCLSLKSGSVATHVTWGILKNDASSAALLQAENYQANTLDPGWLHCAWMFQNWYFEHWLTSLFYYHYI